MHPQMIITVHAAGCGPRFYLFLPGLTGTSTETRTIFQLPIFQRKGCQCARKLFSVPTASNDPPFPCSLPGSGIHQGLGSGNCLSSFSGMWPAASFPLPTTHPTTRVSALELHREHTSSLTFGDVNYLGVGWAMQIS